MWGSVILSETKKSPGASQRRGKRGLLTKLMKYNDRCTGHELIMVAPVGGGRLLSNKGRHAVILA